MISIVIPVKNGGQKLRRCLEGIRNQVVEDRVEIVVVDSGSTDGTQDLARSFGARVHEVPPAEFNHGETRNVGARLAEGEVVVYMVDDAVPVNEHWLDRLTRPLRERPELAATYARQLPNEAAPPHQAYYINHRYGPIPRTQRAETAGDLQVSQAMFSNVSSAIRPGVLAELPFASDIVIAEDAEWCARALRAGHAVRYVPEAVVRHSHVYTLRETVKRYFDLGAASERSIMSMRGASPGSVAGEGLHYLRGELGWMWRSGHRTKIPAALAHEAARYLGFKLGIHHRLVPTPLRARISRTSVYWST